MSDDDTDGDHLQLVSNRQPTPGNRSDEAVALGDAYATAKGQRAADMLEFRRKDGTGFAMPYGYRPILWSHPPDTILIEYPGFFTVALTCKGQEELFKRLSDRRVTWIRECSEALAAGLPTAVTRIEILRSYPSREAGVYDDIAELETDDA
jgi:hypothetical protein